MIKGQQEEQKRLPALEKAIKPAQDAVAAKQKALGAPKAALDQAKAHEAKLAADLKFWEAAAVNTKALASGAEFARLKAEQDDANEAFKELSAKVGALREELGKTEDESKKGEITKQIESTSKEVSELKAAIDQRAPLLARAGKEAKELKDRYLAMLK